MTSCQTTRDPKGMGGAWRDDHLDIIPATHWWCSEEKGSTRMKTVDQFVR
jgi:hypothetical protein